MSVVSVRFSDDEMKALNDFAKLYDRDISSLIKEIVFQHLNDEYDLKVFDEYEKDKKNENLNIRPISDLWKELYL